MSEVTIDEPTVIKNYDLQYKRFLQTMTTVITGRLTCTANIYHIQKELIDNNKSPIT